MSTYLWQHLGNKMDSNFLVLVVRLSIDAKFWTVDVKSCRLSTRFLLEILIFGVQKLKEIFVVEARVESMGWKSQWDCTPFLGSTSFIVHTVVLAKSTCNFLIVVFIQFCIIHLDKVSLLKLIDACWKTIKKGVKPSTRTWKYEVRNKRNCSILFLNVLFCFKTY